MRCPKCGNTSLKMFGINKGKYYCRRCVLFNGKEVAYLPTSTKPVLKLNFSLSKSQKKISAELLNAYKNNKNAFLYAVTGAGKTEITYQTILYVLEQGGRVGFTIPRRDVVIDLLPRLKEAFPNNKIVDVYGGNTENLQGDIVLCTTHQLYRYNNYFDYLIFDEIDAFPYKNNELLESMFKRSIKGQYVLMSATPDKKIVDNVIKSGGVYLKLLRRYHKFDLPVPSVKISLIGMIPLIVLKLKRFLNDKKQCFIFAPTIHEAEKIFYILNKFFPNGGIVHSKKLDRCALINDFKIGKLNYLVTTSILERGVTVKNLQVIVYHADHDLYDDKTLIQIAGRVGRKTDVPTGEVIFYGYKSTYNMETAIANIKMANQWKSA